MVASVKPILQQCAATATLGWTALAGYWHPPIGDWAFGIRCWWNHPLYTKSGFDLANLSGFLPDSNTASCVLFVSRVEEENTPWLPPEGGFIFPLKAVCHQCHLTAAGRLASKLLTENMYPLHNIIALLCWIPILEVTEVPDYWILGKLRCLQKPFAPTHLLRWQWRCHRQNYHPLRHLHYQSYFPENQLLLSETDKFFCWGLHVENWVPNCSKSAVHVT